MNQTKKDFRVDLAALMRQIKGGLDRIDNLTNEVHHVRARLFANTYTWVEGMVAEAKARSETHALQLLAQTVGRSHQATTQWYASGRFMRRHSMSPDDVNPHSVYVARYAEHSLSRPDYLKVASAVKRGVESGKIKKMMNKAEVKSGRAVERRLRTMRQGGLMTKDGGKIEMQVAYRVMRKAFGDGMLAFYDKNGKRIYKVGLDLED